MTNDDRIARLEARLEAMDEALERISAEQLGFKLALMRLAAFLPISERDVTTAMALALAQAEDAMPPDETPNDTALAVLAAIQALFSVAGQAHRPHTAGPSD